MLSSKTIYCLLKAAGNLIKWVTSKNNCKFNDIENEYAEQIETMNLVTFSLSLKWVTLTSADRTIIGAMTGR